MICTCRPHGPAPGQAQENPDLVEQPDKAPEGIDDLPEEIRKLEAEMVFLIFAPPHLLHFTSFSSSALLTIISKTALQSLHL
mgnify:CR=1 FL=1